MDLLSTKHLSDKFGCSQARIAIVIDRLGLGRRIGRNRAVTDGDVPAIEIGLRACNFLKPTGPESGAKAN